MDKTELLPLLGSFLLGGLLAAGAVFAWLSRQAGRDRQRAHHVEQTRQLAAQQLTQARKQIEQLQRENHELRLAVRPTPRAAPAPAPEAPVDAAEATRRYAELKMQPPAARETPRAFKDTEVLKRTLD